MLTAPLPVFSVLGNSSPGPIRSHLEITKDREIFTRDPLAVSFARYQSQIQTNWSKQDMIMCKTISVFPDDHVLLTPIRMHLRLVTRKRDSQGMFRRAWIWKNFFAVRSSKSTFLR